MLETTVSLGEIYQAKKAIGSLVHRTPLVFSSALSRLCGASVYLKLETVHDMGAFKIRGAANRLLNLSGEEQKRGVIATSTGNHGRGIAYAAKEFGIKSVVFMSKLVSRDKVADIESYGSEVHVVGDNFEQTRAAAKELADREGMLMIEPFDDPYIIAGQGTIGLEILEDLPGIETIVVPVGGGGLISGIALALKSADPDIRVVGVTMERGAAMYQSQKEGKPVEVEELETLADNLGGSIGLDNRYTFRLVKEYVDQLVLVSEQQIASAMKFAFNNEKLMIEGAAAVGIAALMNSVAGKIGNQVVVIISSRNVNIKVWKALFAS